MGIRKNPLIAATLSIFIPGAGQIYNRQARKALVWYAIFFLLPLVFILCRCLSSFWGVVLLIFVYIWIYLYNLGDAIYGALRPKKIEPRPWHKIVLVVLLVSVAADVVVIAGYRSKNTVGFRAFRIITNSMAPSIQEGDAIILDLNYYKKNQVQRGNIISFQKAAYKGPLCKRVIGLPGDRIEGKGHEVLVNGTVIHEPYTRYAGRNETLDSFNQKHSTSDFGPITVPEGQLFVMGDNRDNSFDSRDPDFGPVTVESVWAKPLYVYFSAERSRIGKTIK